MSDRIVYLGPALRCRIERVTTHSKMLQCTRPGCVDRNRRYFPDQGEFCSRCGTVRDSVEIPHKQEKVNARTILASDALINVLNAGCTHRLFIPNVSRGQLRRLSFDPDDDFEELIATEATVQPDAEIQWFAHAFTEEIAAVEAAYGEDNAKLVWVLFSEDLNS